MRISAPRLLLAAAAVQLAVGLALALAASQQDAPPVGRDVHALVLTSGLALAAMGLALALLPAFTGREPRSETGWLPLVGAILVDALALPFGILGPAAMAAPLVLALPAFLVRGARVEGHALLAAESNPHRVGDRVALASLVAGLLGVLAGAILLVVVPRGLPTAGLTVLLLAGVLPLAMAVPLFLLPRARKAPLAGATLMGASLGVLLLATLALAVSFSLLGAAGFRAPAAGVLLAHVLALAAFARVKLAPAVEGPLAHVRPLLRAAAALALVAGLVLLFSLAPDAPTDLLPMAFYAHAVLALVLLVAGAHLAAPFLGLRPAGRPLWTKLGAALLIAGLFLLAPSFQYPRSAFPGAAVLALGALSVTTPLLLTKAETRRARRKR